MSLPDRIWYERHPLYLVLAPFSLLFCIASALRRLLYRKGWLAKTRLPVPVIVVGNIVVGGTGKTPLVMWLVERLREAGFSPGIVTRGYRGNSSEWPREVTMDSDPTQVGDEAVLLALRCGCPVYAAPKRARAAQRLLESNKVDVLICDDGLQHYALERDIELAVMDTSRLYGNGLCLPAGPLRERRSRLHSVDRVVCHGDRAGEGDRMRLRPNQVMELATPDSTHPISHFVGQRVHAVAGIGNPARFFRQLRGAGLDVIEHPFPDHHPFVASDLEFDDNLPILLTEKDAVKLGGIIRPGIWVVTARIEVNKEITDFLVQRLNELGKHDSGQQVT